MFDVGWVGWYGVCPSFLFFLLRSFFSLASRDWVLGVQALGVYAVSWVVFWGVLVGMEGRIRLHIPP